MDFNDDRSIFPTNSQLGLDMQNIQQNDYIQSNYDDSHMLPYFIDDPPNYNHNQTVLNQCEQPNVLLTNHQSSNSLKAQNSTHPTQQTNINNRSRINPHHFYQSQNQQFHNQTPTSKQFQPITNNLSNVPINQQMNYVNIPSNKDNDSLIYSDVVNPNLNNQIFNKKDLYRSNQIIINGVTHQLPRPRPRLQRPQIQLHPQMNVRQNTEHIETNNLLNKNPTYSTDTNLSSPNNLSINKNSNNNLLIKNTVQQQQRAFYSPPPNYSLHHTQNNLQQTGNTNKFINNGLNYNFNDTNNNANNTINNNLSNLNQDLNNVNCNIVNTVNNVNLIKSTQPKIQDKQITNFIIDNTKIQQNNLNNSNSINSNLIKLQDNKSQLNELNKNLDNRIISQELKIDNKIKVDDKTVDTHDKTNNESTKKQKAETKTIVIFKVIDQVFLNGNLVKETIVKNDEITKHTGLIDWPINENLNNDNELKIEIKNSETIKNDKPNKLDKNLKKISPKSKANLKRSIKQNSSNSGQIKDDKIKEKKVKTELDQKLNDKINAKNDSSDINLVNNNQLNNNLKLDNINNELTDKIQKDSTLNESINEEIKYDSINQSAKTESIKPIVNLIDEPIFTQIEVNKKVLAKWSDKNWYSGVVLKQESDKYKIKFDDGANRSVREEEILNIEYIPKLQSVMFILPSDGLCAKGIVKSYRIDESTNQKYYLIEYLLNNRYVETEYKAENVYLTSEAGLSLISKRKQNVNDSKFADVDLNNIIPRSQRTRVSSNKNESTNLNTINDKALTPSNSIADIENIDNDSNSNLSNSTNSSTTNSKKQQKKTTKAIKQQQLNNISLNEDTNSNLQDLISPSSINSLDFNSNDDQFDLIGPILKNSNLFKSFAFLISSNEQINSNEQAGCYSIPFDLNHLIKQIRSGSGVILDKFEDVKDTYQAVLISHSFAKTIKYITALALGIPCVKYTWIVDCCKKSELVRMEDYILPNGYSVITKQLIQDRTIYKKSQTLFKGTKIYFISTDSETTKWLPLLKATKSIVLNILPENLTRKQNCMDLIVTDKTCPLDIVTKANNLKIPLVSIEYIIASLIHGKKLSFNLHPTFQHNYTTN